MPRDNNGLVRHHLMRCESVTLRTHWVQLVMDQYTRRIIGFGIQVRVVNQQLAAHCECGFIKARKTTALAISEEFPNLSAGTRPRWKLLLP
jgi:hypothetical protein